MPATRITGLASFSRQQFVPRGNSPLTYFQATPVTPVQGQVILLHGIESHPQWFEGTCHWLAAKGFRVCALQRRGSGTDVNTRGDIDTHHTWVEDVNLLAEKLQQEFPQAPIHVMGISWGGKLASVCATENPAWMKSLILISPGLMPRVSVPLLTKLHIVWSYWLDPAKRFKLPLARAAMFTANDRWQEFIQTDSLRLQEVTARFLGENAKLDRLLRKHRAKIRIPVALLLAQTDEIIDIAKTKRYVSSFGSTTQEVWEYPGSVHTLEFEQDPEPWRQDVLRWLLQLGVSSLFLRK